MSLDFLDSNVLIYLFDRQDTRRRGIAEQFFATPKNQAPPSSVGK